jgi:Fic family protein
MRDIQLSHLDKRLSSLPASVYSKLSELDQLRGRWHAAQDLPTAIASNLKKSVLATSTGASTRIEGSKLSDDEVAKVMKGLEVTALADRDEQEVRGYFEVLEVIFYNYPDIKFTENQILSFHSYLLRYAKKDQQRKGSYKHSENEVQLVDANGKILGKLFKTTPAYLTPKQMSELVAWTNTALGEKLLHPMVVIASFVVEFLKIHPFTDGNGRMSRLLTNLLLLKTDHDYALYSSHEKLVEASKIDYYLALRRTQATFGTDNEDITPWLDYFIDICIAQLVTALSLVNSSSVEKFMSPSQKAVWEFLQIATNEVPIRDIVSALKIPRPTVAQSLYKLIEYKLIERVGLGRSARYRKL